MRIYLIGYMASGKSWLGKELAAEMDYEFIDLDESFETRYRISILEFFEKYGENLFRNLEQDILRETSTMDQVIISTGGGAPCHSDSMDFVLASGISIYLRMSISELVERISKIKKKRPLLKNVLPGEMEEFVRDQLSEREKYYLKANYIFEGPDYTVKEILRVLRFNSDTFST
ncbi:MAG: shikimate kinase [Bacteroidales bacterium]|nr:shikimate kinase [Bacteroidales bacterium]